ncbi:endonuclease domain-containing 1 protein-like [Alligator sinensis]|uniref:Endonuclease domain-containing 1 protein-like n=1 Tax=Alligator sinensis TaxID=38654 RepID=A0A3Q0FTW7_ALLSI|nr:endonuclease domain-containing 1 protein-like [Alligator sinensis]
MGLLVLLGCVSLWAGLALAEGGSSFINCQQYLYKTAEPEGFDTQETRKICQRFNNAYHFATLYDRQRLTPHWSAYTLKGKSCDKQPQRKSSWFVEPQLKDGNTCTEMKIESESGLGKHERNSTQAISEDYENTNYDRGHLNPNSFQCGSGRTATFTLTNAVPMDPCFNRIHWGKLEKSLKDKLTINCLNENGTAYLVTGAVGGTEKIPKENGDKEGDRERTYERVAVPSHIWTDVCCDNANNNRKFSFAFLAENKEEPTLQVFPAEQLNEELRKMYKSLNIRVLADDCNAQSPKTEEVIESMKKDLNGAFRDLKIEFQYSPPSKKKKVFG